MAGPTPKKPVAPQRQADLTEPQGAEPQGPPTEPEKVQEQERPAAPEPEVAAAAQPPARIESRSVQLAREFGVGGSGLVPKNFEQLWNLANRVCNTPFAPKDFQGKPESCAMAMQYGMELGLTPLQGLQCIAVINGRPALFGDVVPAICAASGELEYVHESIEGEWKGDATADDVKFICIVKRKGRDEYRNELTVGEAKKAGLWNRTGRDGQPTPWVTYKRRMMTWRPRHWSYRDAFPDRLKGLKSVEEAADMEPLEVTAREIPVTQKRERFGFTGEAPAPTPAAKEAKAQTTAKPPAQMDCPTCERTGSFYEGEKLVECSKCGGTGQIEGGERP